MNRILVVEDEENIADYLVTGLREEGQDVLRPVCRYASFGPTGRRATFLPHFLPPRRLPPRLIETVLENVANTHLLAMQAVVALRAISYRFSGRP
jgi:hypothetical protein